MKKLLPGWVTPQQANDAPRKLTVRALRSMAMPAAHLI